MEMEVRWVGGLQTCYVSLPLSLVHALESTQSGFLPPVVALELRPLDASTNHQQRWHLAWSGSPSNSAAIEVAHQLGESIGLPDRAKVQIRAMSTLPRAEMVRIEPAGEDDWEVLELNSEHAEETILKQLGVAYEGMTFPLWLHAHTIVLFSVTSVLPKRSVVQLVPGTEVVVAPKVRNKNTSSKGVSTTRPSLKGHLLSRVLLRVQDLPKNMIKEAEVNGVKFGVLPTSLAFVHPETTNGLEFSIPQLVILMSRVSRNGSLKGQEDASGKKSSSHNEDTDNASPITGKKTSKFLVVHLLHSDSVAKGHIILPWSLQFYLGTPLHSWVYVKKYNQCPVEDISSLSLSPFWFRLSQSQESHKMNSMDSSGGQLKDINETNGSRRDYAVGDDLIDWSIHEELLETVPFLYSEHQPDASKPLNKEGLFSVWIAKQMNIGASEIGQGWIPSIVVGKETLFHLRIDMNQFCKLHGQGNSKTSRSSAKGCKEEGSKIDILFLLTADFGLTDQKSTCEVSVSTDKGQISYAALEKLHGKLSLGKPISLDYVEGRSFNPSFDVALSSLQWMEKSVSETLNRITVILSPWLGKLFNAYNLPFPGHVLIYGPPGSGKTSLASAVAKHFEDHKDILAHVLFVSCSKLAVEKLQTVRQGLANCISEALSYSPSLVVFDDLDTVASSSESEASPVSNSTNSLAEFLADIMDEFRDKRKTSCLIGPVAFIATTQSLDSLPRCLSSSGRLDFHVQLPAPAAEERAAMLKHELHKRALLCSEDTPSLISSKCDGYDAYDLEILVDRAVHAAIGRTVFHDVPDKEEKPILLIDDFLQAMDGFVPVAMRGITKPGGEGGRVGWEDVGGLSEVRKAIQEMIELPSRFPNIFKRAPLRLRSNVLLYGPPGCGKTHIVGAAAAACNLRFISVKGPELLNKYIGASEQAVRDIFSKAAMAAPSLLFFDEFDSIAPKRGHDNTGVTDRVVNQFLTELDGVEALTGVFVFAATSRPDLLDAALLRPGRLDRLLFCDFPSKDERLEILKVLSRKLPMAGNVDLEEVASLTEGFSGADIQALLSDAQLASVHKLLESPDGSKPGKAPIIDHALLKTVALKSRPSVSPSEKQRLYGIYNQFSEAKKSIAAQSRDAKGKRATLA